MGHRVSELIFLDENGLSPDLTRFLYEFETIGTKNSPVFLYLKSGSGHGLENSSDVTYIFQMLEDAQEQAQHILKNRDPEKVYLELPEKAKVCRKVTTDSLQVCATLVEQHQFLYKVRVQQIYRILTSYLRVGWLSSTIWTRRWQRRTNVGSDSGWIMTKW